MSALHSGMSLIMVIHSASFPQTRQFMVVYAQNYLKTGQCYMFTNEDPGRAPLSDDLLPEWLRIITLMISLR
ncbi:MAG: hypothetical protein ACP5NC_08650 [Nitrososphaeria archaeon]